MNRKLGLLSSVAAAVLLSAGIAAAQPMNKDSNNPASANSEMHHSKAHKKHAMKSAQGQSPSKAAKSANSQAMNKSNKAETTGEASGSSQAMKQENKARAADHAKANKSARMNGQKNKNETTGAAAGHESRAMSHRKNAETTGQAGTNGEAAKHENKAQTTGQASERHNKNETTGQAAGSQMKQNKAQTTGEASGKTNEHQSKANTGAMNAANAKQSNGQQADNERHARGVNLTAQQQSKVEKSVFSRRNVPRENNVNFSINLGTAVPHRVHVVAVPETLISVHPRWRGDHYFVTRNEIVVINPHRKIVAVIPARNYEASNGTTIGAASLPAAEIRDVQKVLVDRGYLHGAIDGIFGPKTRAALISFQRHDGLRPSGRLNHRTVASLGLSDEIEIGGPSTVGQGQ